MALNYDVTAINKPNWKRLVDHPLWTTNFFTMEIGLIACDLERKDFYAVVTLENWRTIAMAIVNARIYIDKNGVHGFHAGKYTISDIMYGVYLHIGAKFWKD